MSDVSTLNITPDAPIKELPAVPVIRPRRKAAPVPTVAAVKTALSTQVWSARSLNVMVIPVYSDVPYDVISGKENAKAHLSWAGFLHVSGSYLQLSSLWVRKKDAVSNTMQMLRRMTSIQLGRNSHKGITQLTRPKIEVTVFNIDGSIAKGCGGKRTIGPDNPKKKG